jgi:uncharacterized tellurite resistance protein B-like protein
MNNVLQKKINLLVYLAKADGQFHASEKKFLRELLAEHGVKNLDLQSTNARADVFNDASSILEKEELLFWAFQLVKADGLIHPEEVSFCKKLAKKLKFLPDIVDTYANEDLPTLNDFVAQSVKFRAQ